MDFRLTEKWHPQLLALLRIMTALLFMEHGLAKLFHFPVPQPGVPTPLPALLLAAAIIEIVGGVLVTVGLFTRVAAFLMAGEIAIGYFLFHFPRSFWPIVNEGDAAILFCFVFLYISASGPGAWSLDAARMKAPRP
ncbi:MAG TPA: DoxX family protein [Sphingomicrobium sp.]|nr:DoxX family protein [Sphingomicrobium sp.]